MARRRSAMEWKRIVLEFEATDEDVESFCATRDFRPSTLRSWRSTFGMTKRGRKKEKKRTSGRAGSRGIKTSTSSEPLTVRLVNALSETPGVSAAVLAIKIKTPYRQVLKELTELEGLGIVVRKGWKGSTSWYVG